MADALGRNFASAGSLGLLGPRLMCVLQHVDISAAQGRPRHSPPWGVLAVAVVVLTLSLSSCGPKRAAAEPPVPEPRVTRAPRPSSPPSSEPVSEPQTVTSLPSPQPVPPEAVPETTGPLVGQPQERASSEPEPVRPRPIPNTPPVTSEPVTQPELPAAPVPQLGQMLSLEQRQQYNAFIDQAIKRAQDRLKVVVAYSARLNDEQHATIKRIQAFILQAEEKRKDDLTIAKNLADRAQLLAEDLAKNFK